MRHPKRLLAATLLGAVLGVTTASHLNSQEVVLQVGKAGVRDDYVCWGPSEVRIRDATQPAQPRTVTIAAAASDPSRPSGELAFVDIPPTDFANAHTKAKPRLDVTLPKDGSWKLFYVMGTKASNADKDVSIVVTSGTTKLLTHGVMVRVRKNAETLSADERRRFLEAFVKAARLNNQFARYWGVHTDAVRLAHRMAFLPWHRALLIQLERELQVEDPSVALPYWEFDKPAPKLFSEDFFGRVGGAANPSLVVFSTTNPLAGWGLTDPRVSPLTRFRNGDTSVSSGIHKGTSKNCFWEKQHEFDSMTAAAVARDRGEPCGRQAFST